MDDLGFGLWLMVTGMGVVFGLLVVLMLVLTAIGRFDARPRPAPGAAAPPDAAERVVLADADDLSPEAIAAITVAVLTHARIRRLQAAPAMRSYEPGSHLFASRWVAVGRTYQNQPWRKRN